MKITAEQLYAAAPYLRELRERHAGWIVATGGVDPDTVLKSVLDEVADAGRAQTAEPEFGAQLRRAKQRVALLAALAETNDSWSTARSTAALSDMADGALAAALEFLMRRAAEKGQVGAASATAATSGLALFGLGKLGGRELNYSSDIDIVAFFDPALAELSEPAEATKFYSRLVQKLASLMQDRTDAGYVFRTDLRLRPDPGSTPVALPVDAALAYYEARGQNWERAAWIKGRVAAGDARVGDAFLKDLQPYVWRKHLDFATIADIQAMKRQINIARNVGDVRVEGHNVKLGLGGIREIEFFTQTQQLIAGGRDASLRVRPTSDALEALAKAGWIAPRAARQLTEAYWFLRAVENRLQMRADQQTHVMPDTADGISVVAAMLGENDPRLFSDRYIATLNRVLGYYSELFAEGTSLAAVAGNLVFTGSDDDPGTLETLASLGFKDAARAIATVRKWHYGGYGATRAAAARAHLTELLPALLATLGEAGNPDDALARFDQFLARLPAGVQFFALLRNHERLRSLIVLLLASAPRMADQVIQRAHVMDALIDPAFADELQLAEAQRARIEAFLGEARDYQEVIDRARIIGQEQMFLISAGLLAGRLDATRTGSQFTTVAETLLARLFEAARHEVEHRHGQVPGAQVTLLALGKLASREMTARSDLDLVMLYDAPADVAESDGGKPLATSHYFIRLTQRLLAAVSAPTAEGVLYEADLRLRPSGNAGPVATSLNGFLQYHRENAWTWEHMALSRARPVYSTGGLGGRIEVAIADILARPRDASKTIDDVVAMRERLARDRKPRHPFDLKLQAGGLVDLEFIAQSAQLVARREIAEPAAGTARTLERLGEIGLVPEGGRLAVIHATFSEVLQVMSAALSDPFREEGWTDGFRELLAHRTNYPTFERLSEDLAAMEAEVVGASSRWYSRAREF
jgi:glutamate-ammonia-ligase adenylyltransferase